MGMVDNTLFTKKKSSNLIIVQIYVDDIIFGSTCQDMCDEFAKIMHDEFEMSMMGELNFFLGLQIKQMEDGIFFNQSKYIKEMLKKFRLEDSKPMKTPMSSDTKLMKDEECESVDSTKYRGMIGTTHLGLWYPKGTGIETIVYADSDHAGDYVDRKSTSGICTFVGCCLTSWFSKKQTALAISTTEAEYVSVEKACQQALIDYDVRLDDVSIMCDNKGAIDLSKNPVQHSRTKHIEIRHHFLRDNVQKGHISIKKSMFSHIDFDCLLEINEQICPRFILEFYSQYHLEFSDEGQILVQFVIQNNFFSYTLEEFGQILGIPHTGACVFTDKWSLDDLQYSVPSSGLYQTDPPCPDEIKIYVQEEREGPVHHIRHKTKVLVDENEILTREIVSVMKPWVEIIRENVFCLGVVQESYVLYDRVMYPLTAQQERKTRKDYGTKRGRHSTSSSSAFDHPSSSHLNDDGDDGNDEGTSRASTPSPAQFVNSLTNEVP
ncbi:retrovirus-related pol polyprotein from transposon TNT 1-94 [Tanacetum coccineum]|uniref:Retrovirus-related pol polyprotein from transposon TNT 1-94 n=1 Tax=Tanacetum coccineum TaxID=301880 RepID=A0ABQ5FGA7_9ASTR